jgi:hypothetical protein
VLTAAPPKREPVVQQRRGEVRLCAQGIGAQRSAVVRERGLGTLLLLVEVREVEMRLDVRRLAGKRAFVTRERIAAPILLVLDRAVVAVGIGQLRIDR